MSGPNEIVYLEFTQKPRIQITLSEHQTGIVKFRIVLCNKISMYLLVQR